MDPRAAFIVDGVDRVEEWGDFGVQGGGAAGEEFVLGHLTASRTGGEAPTSIDDAVHVLEVIDAALESSATGRTIKIAGA